MVDVTLQVEHLGRGGNFKPVTELRIHRVHRREDITEPVNRNTIWSFIHVMNLPGRFDDYTHLFEKVDESLKEIIEVPVRPGFEPDPGDDYNIRVYKKFRPKLGNAIKNKLAKEREITIDAGGFTDRAEFLLNNIEEIL